MKKLILFFVCLFSLLYTMTVTHASTGTSLDQVAYEEWFNSNFGNFNAPFNMNDSVVDVDGATGRMTVHETDLHLPGKNGFDLTITREYNSLHDIVRDKTSGNFHYTKNPFIQARYILPNGSVKLVRFVTADEYYQNGTAGIYTNSNYANTYTRLYYEMESGSIYLQRDTSYEPRWENYDRDDQSRFFSDQSDMSCFASVRIGYNWSINFAYSHMIAGPFPTGFTNQYYRYRLYRLTDGRAITVKETYRLINGVLTNYYTDFENFKGYEILRPYEGMADSSIVDNEKGITYFYSIRDKNGFVWYFNINGTISAEEDKYGNIIKYQYTTGAVTITDTMGRVVKIHKNSGNAEKISLTVNGISEDMVYYNCFETDVQPNDFSDYYSKYSLEVKKIEDNESKNDCNNTTVYEMAKRTNVYNNSTNTTPFLQPTYILKKITKPDGNSSVFDYTPGRIINNKCYPLWEYMPTYSADVQTGGTVENEWNYSYTDTSSNYHEFRKERGDGIYSEVLSYRRYPLQVYERSITGDGIGEVEYYSYVYKKSILESQRKRKYNLPTANHYIESVTNYKYDERDNCIYINNMGQEVWYDYGDSTTNPFNLLLLKTFENDGKKIKTENTSTADLKGIQDTKEYVKENSVFVMQSHTSYEYDSYGNVSKVTERPQFTTPVEHHILYTYNLPKYSVEQYTLNVTNFDNTSVSKIGTLTEYDKYGRLWRTTDGEENQTTFSYDRIGRLLGVTNADGTTKGYDYDVLANTVTAVNENGTEIKQTFDMRGRKLASYVFNPTKQQYIKLQEISYNKYNGLAESVMELGADNKEIFTFYTWDDAGKIKKKLVKEKNTGGTYTLVEEATNEYKCPSETATWIRAVGDSSNNTHTVYSINSSNTQKTFNITNAYDYVVMNLYVSATDYNHGLRVYIDSAEGTQEFEFLPNRNNRYYETNHERSFIINTDGVTSIRVARYNSVIGYVSNVRGYTKEQIAAMTTKATTTVTGDSTITPPKVEQTFDFWGNKTKQQVINATNPNIVIANEIWTYDSLGNNLTYRNPVSSALNMDTYTRTYDYAGRLTRENIHDNQFGNRINNVVYDKVGRIVNKYNTDNNYSYQYDQLGRVIAENHHTNGGKNYKYDKNGNVIREQETIQQFDYSPEEYNTTDYAYDNRSRLIKTTQYKSGTDDPQITQFYYDAVGNILRLYTGLSMPLTINGLDDVTTNGDTEYTVTKYEYNFMNQLESVTDALNQTESYTYDYLGNVLTKEDRNGNLISYIYNWRSQPLKIISSKVGETISYTYDRLGNRKSMSDETGNTNYEYNNLSQLVTETKKGVVKTYSYDKNGKRTNLGLSVGTDILLSNSYMQSNTGWLRSVNSGSKTVYYNYNIAGKVTSETMDDIVSTRSYNTSNYLSDMTNTINGVVKSDFTYTLLMNGNVSEVSSTYANSTAQATSYTYDGIGRLLTEQSPNVNHTFTYDDNGNRSTMTGGKSYQYDLNNRLKIENGSEGADYQYDPNGNLFSKINWNLTDEDGSAMTFNLSEDLNDVAFYTYDSFNRLMKIEDGENVYEYEYNGDGQRTAKIVNGTRTDYIWDGFYIVAEICEETTTSYIRGLRLHFSENNNGEVMFYLYNGHGDVVQTLDENKATVNKYQYDAFGNEINPNPTDTNPWRYCGEYTDLETNNIYLRNRYYDPSVGRFISEDPIRDGLNWYVYCDGDPVNRIDITGLEWGWIRDFTNDLGKIFGPDYKFNFGTTRAGKEYVNVDLGGGYYAANGRFYMDGQADIPSGNSTSRESIAVNTNDKLMMNRTDYYRAMGIKYGTSQSELSVSSLGNKASAIGVGALVTRFTVSLATWNGFAVGTIAGLIVDSQQLDPGDYVFNTTIAQVSNGASNCYEYLITIDAYKWAEDEKGNRILTRYDGDNFTRTSYLRYPEPLLE